MATGTLEPTTTFPNRDGSADKQAMLQSGREEQPTWADVNRSLAAIESLGADWDGQGAAKPSVNVTANARGLIRGIREKFSPPNFVRATPDGNIAFEWRLPTAVFEVEVCETVVEAAIFRPGLPIVTFNTPVG